MKKRLFVGAGVLMTAFACFFITLAVMYHSIQRAEKRVDMNWASLENAYYARLELVADLQEFAQNRVNATYAIEALDALSKQSDEIRQTSVTLDITSDRGRLEHFQGLQEELSTSLNNFFSVINKFPELINSQVFLELKTRIRENEKQIGMKQDSFNQAVRAFNTKIKVFPNSVVAAVFQFHKKAYLPETKKRERILP